MLTRWLYLSAVGGLSLVSVRAARFVFFGLCVAYLAAVIIASGSPGPLAWGLHSLGFLGTGARSLLVSLYLCAGVLILWGCVSGSPRPAEARRAFAVRFQALRRPGPLGVAALLLAFCASLYFLRARTHLLGDGTVWLTILKTGQHQLYSEPLAAAIWTAFGSVIRALVPSPDAGAFGLLSILCGGLSFLICLALANHLVAERGARAEAVALLLTLGITELYCGYLESYPLVVVLILAYLWLGLRSLVTRGAFALTPVLLSLATASHFLSLYLWPSYLFLVSRRERRMSHRALWCLVPAILTPALAVAAGSRPNDWIESSRIALHAALLPGASAKAWNIGGPVGLWHALDMANEALLIMPVALLLAIGGLTTRAGRQWLASPEAKFLAAATLSGLIAAFLLVLPAPALDWDLFALLMVPAGVLSVGLGIRLLQGEVPMPFRVGMVSLALCAVLPFLLVNASEDASLRRFKTLIGPGTRISVQSRAYPNSVLAQFYEDRGDYRSALLYAERAYGGEPTNPRYSVKLANEHFQLGEYASASRYYEEAIHRGWDRASSRHDLGLSYALAGRDLDAVRELRIAVGRPDGARPDYFHDFGVAYANAGYADSARTVWTSLLRRWPGYAPTIRSLASRYAREPLAGPPR